MTPGNSQPVEPYGSRAFLLLLFLFAASGCSALIYEIVWYQLLQFVIGASALSLAVLLATFMGGLFLGSFIFPSIPVMRRYHPLRLYAALELGIGLCGALVYFGMPLISHVYVAAIGHGLPHIFLRAATCSVCLLLPTLLMGAALPAVARSVEMSRRGVRWLGFWYAANTAGAVFGCLLAGFYLLRIFDMAIATYAAVAINILVAIVSFALSLRTPACVHDPAPAQAEAPTPAIVWTAYLAIALSGASALGAEVVWTRLLGLILGATVYTFSVVLAVFLVGLALGSGAGSLLSTFVSVRKALGYCQLCLVAAIFWTAFMLAKSLPYWPVNPKIGVSPWITFQFDLVRALWAMLPPTLLWGASFPLAIAAVASREDDPARPVAGIYAANTCGAILGAVCFSLFLIPRLGTQQSQRVLLVLSALGALCVLLPRGERRTAQSSARIFGLVVAMALATLLVARVPAVPAQVIAWGRLAASAPESTILYAGEGLNSSIAVSQEDDTVTFHVSGRVEASTNRYDMRNQRMLGDLPALLQPAPHSVLIVGFGAGVTAGSFVPNPDVHRIVICELEPLVPPATTRFFGKENFNVLHDPRTQIVYDDARNYILTTPEKFDVITSDPIHPWVKGSATLYTKEYFELAKQHLNPDGVVAQWVPLYETDLASVKSEIATFFDVFPDGTIWANQGDTGSYDLVLLGRAHPAVIQVDALQSRLDQPALAGVVESLREVGLESAPKLLSTYEGQASDLKPWLAGAALNLDGNLRLQYLAGMAVNAGARRRIDNVILGYSRFPYEWMQGSSHEVQAVRDEWIRRLAHNSED